VHDEGVLIVENSFVDSPLRRPAATRPKRDQARTAGSRTGPLGRVC
jgi:hypothetical protein